MGRKSKKKKKNMTEPVVIVKTVLKESANRTDIGRDRFSFDRLDLILGIAGFLLVFICYIFTLAPTIFFGDSGEFATASYHLGIVHPPGYPLYTLLGKLFMVLVPFGDMAYRMNLMSAFFASAAAVVCYLILRILGAGRLVSVLVIPLTAFSMTFWSEAVVTEVYTLNALFFCLILMFFLWWMRDGNDRLLLWLALICGLALTHHITIAAFYPVLLAGIIIKKPSILKNLRLIAKLFIWAVIPLLLYLYLPIRSAANPPTDWGNPETFKAVINHITARQYSGKLLEHGLQGVAIQLKAFLGLIVQQFTPSLLILILPGLVLLFRRSKNALFFLLAFFIVNIIYSISYYIVDIDSYFIPSFIIAAIFIALGLQSVIEPIRRASVKALKPPAVFSIIVISCIPLISSWEKCDHSGNYLARNFGENILKTIAKDGIFMSHGDNESFVTAYLTLVEKQRTDVAVYDRTQNLLPFPIVHEKETANKPAINEFERQLVFNSDKHVYFNFDPDDTYPLVEDGLLYRVVRAGDSDNDFRDPWKEYNLEGLDDESLYDDFMTRFIVGKYFEAYARYYWNLGKREISDEYLEKALTVAGDQATMWIAIGFFDISKGRDERAEKELLKGLELNPFSSDCCNGLGTVAYNREEYKKALEWYEKSYALDDKNTSALINIGLANEKLGDKESDGVSKGEYYRKAAESFQTVREINPYDKQMERNLNRISEKFAPARDVMERYEQQALQEPKNATVMYDYGVYLAKQNMFEAAIKQFRKAIEVDEKYISAIVDLGGAYLKLRKEDLAYEQFTKALIIEPGNKKALAGVKLIKDAVKTGKVQMKIRGLVVE
jgi:tetratricopeptide (TPR) repeat protein